MVIIDTNIVIDHLRRPASDSILMKFVEKVEGSVGISTITIQELYTGKSTLVREKEIAMLNVISPLDILDYNYEIAEIAGRLTRDTRGAVTFADSAIAATAIYYEAKLLTLNVKHFRDIEGLELLDFC